MNAITKLSAIDQVITDRYAIYNGDSCELIRAIPDNSVHFGIHSPPFEGLYKFSNSERDISNNEGRKFWNHYAYLIHNINRITKPGRLHSVHCMQLPLTKTRDGAIGMRDFRGEIVRAWCGDEASEIFLAIECLVGKIARHVADGKKEAANRANRALLALKAELDDATTNGWIYHSEVCIWKDPVVAQQRTKSHRLLHKNLQADSSISGQGLADYVVTFRKRGENEVAIAGMLEEWVGDPSAIDLSDEAYAKHVAEMANAPAIDGSPRKPWPRDMWTSVLIWQRYASPVWSDIDQMRTLQNKRFNPAAGDERDEQDEQHISPLQLDVIERCIQLWSLPGEVVYTPFLGIGSEVWAAVNMSRFGIGSELKPSYFKQAVRNLAALTPKQRGLFV